MLAVSLNHTLLDQPYRAPLSRPSCLNQTSEKKIMVKYTLLIPDFFKFKAIYFFSIFRDAPTLRLNYSRISIAWNQEENKVGGSVYIVWSAGAWSCVKSIRGNCQSIMRLSNQLNPVWNTISSMLSNIRFKINLSWIHRTKLSACWFLAQMPKILL